MKTILLVLLALSIFTAVECRKHRFEKRSHHHKKDAAEDAARDAAKNQKPVVPGQAAPQDPDELFFIIIQERIRNQKIWNFHS